MRRLRFLGSAKRDLAGLEDYLTDFAGPETAARFVDAIVERLPHLAALPGILGTARPDLDPELRSTPHHNIILYFRYRADEIEVVAILDTRRDTAGYFGTPEDG